MNPIELTPEQKSDSTTWFAEHIQPHEQALRAYLRTIAPPSDIDDIIQETFIRLIKAFNTGPIASPRGLLFAAARNTTRDLFRKRASSHVIPVAENTRLNVIDSTPSVPDVVCKHQEIEILTAAIAALPSRCREILVLRKFENLSHREIAQRLGIAEHTVEAQLTKALHRCEDFFAQHRALPR